MLKLAHAYMPIILHAYPYRTALTQPWLIGYQPNPAHMHAWKYMDIDAAQRPARDHR